MLQYPSGHSNLTYAVRLGERAFVLRRAAVRQQGEDGARYGAGVPGAVSKLHAVYAPAPEVLDFCEDPGCWARRFT